MVRTGYVLLAALAVVIGASAASASPITGVEKALSDFSITGTALLTVTATYNYNDTFTGKVSSQAYALSDGTYLCLYQVDNWGPSIMEAFTVNSMNGVTGGGWLSSGEPAPFQVGGLPFFGGVFDYNTGVTPPYVSFNYHSVLDNELPAGQHTAVLYLVSTQTPVVGEAYVIDSGIGVVPAVVTVPEPATLGLLALGGAALLARRRTR